MKSFLSIAALTLSLFSSVAFADMKTEMLDPVVQLNANCSATVVSSDRDKTSDKVSTYVLTAHHCVEDSSARIHNIMIPIYQDGKPTEVRYFKAQVKTTSPSADLSLLKLLDEDTLFTNVVAVAKSTDGLVEGEPVWTVGYPLGMARTITEGLLGPQEYMPFPDGTKDVLYLRATPQIAGGNSGGALFHKKSDGKWEQIGVTTATVPASDFVSVYTRADEINNFLHSTLPLIFKETSTPTPGKSSL